MNNKVKFQIVSPFGTENSIEGNFCFLQMGKIVSSNGD
jgi:hypothetical protein